MTHRLAPRLVACLLLLGSLTFAQDEVPVVGFHLPLATGWSTITNPTASPITSTPIVITRANSPWMKVWFGSTNLGVSSAIKITGVQDQFVQVLDAASLASWSDTSAYFNGDTVVVELVVPPGDSASAFIAGYDTGFDSMPSTDTICGTVDNRVPSTERRVGRLMNASMNAICSGGLITPNSCYLTAGHCVTGGTVFTVEFNCPQSTATGTIVHPAPIDQYPLDFASMTSENGGIGHDYALARLNANTSTGLPAALVQGHYALATAMPPVGTLTRITGFGTASGTGNLSNKTATGNLTVVGGSNGTTLNYLVDTTGGNSGSSVVRDSNQTVFGIHTNGGCTSTGGSNSGTATTYAPVQTQYAAICTPNPPGFAITVAQAGAGAPVSFNVVNAPASSELYNIVSLTPASPTNSGPTVGIIIDAFASSAASLPLGTGPFHVLANAAGSYAFSTPTSLPGMPVNFDVVSVAFTPGTGFASYLGRSPAINATVQL